MKISKPLVTLDLETTGTWVEKDKIVEIGMIKSLPDGGEENFIKRVNPGIPIPPDVIQIINITDEDVKDEPFFREIAGEVVSFIGDADLCGFNLERFDIPLLERELVEAGQRVNMTGRIIYDTQKIYHINEKRDLTAAYKFYCGKELEEAHTALGDAKATLEILKEQIKKYGKEGSVESMKQYDYRPAAQFYDSDRKFRWWNGELFPMFGKYARRKSLQQLARSEQDYLEWILKSDFSEEVKDLVKNALNGEFPELPGARLL